MQSTTRKKSRREAPRFTRLPLTSAIYLALSAASVASAQDANTAADLAATLHSSVAAEAADQETRSEEWTLETITVTAEKRTEDVQKVPISMVVLGTQELEQNYVSDFKD